MEDRLRRAVTLPSGFELKLEQSRPLHFPQAVFWFEATFVSDQKEQDLLTVAVDVHHGRQVRHLDRLLDRSHLAEKPWSPLAEAPHPGLRTAYPIARDRVVRTLSALANTYHRELHERLDRQLERISRYYGDLRAEVEEQLQKARNREGDLAKFIARLESLTREEAVAKCRATAEEPVEGQPAAAQSAGNPSTQAALANGRGRRRRRVRSIGRLEWVWDPLVETIEAAVCPECGHPTFEFGVTRQGRLVCPACAKRRARLPGLRGDNQPAVTIDNSCQSPYPGRWKGG